MLARTARCATQERKKGYYHGCTGACGSGPVTARSVQQSSVRPGPARYKSVAAFAADADQAEKNRSMKKVLLEKEGHHANSTTHFL